MRVRRAPDVEHFLERAGDFLAAREAEHNLLLGLMSRLRRNPRFYGEDPYFAVAEADGATVAAALRTPPHNLILSEVDDARAIDAFAEDAHGAFGALPGLLGPTDAAAAFVGSWSRLTGARARLSRAERIYRAAGVSVPTPVEGAMRAFAPADRAVAARWLAAFVEETGIPNGGGEEILARRLDEPDGGIVVWDAEGPVSLAGFGGPTPNGIRIGPVYTPPELRGRGYASALVAALTQSLLDGGRRFCFLFTDLANPTSNSIYQRIGYRPVTDVDEWVFEAEKPRV